MRGNRGGFRGCGSIVGTGGGERAWVDGNGAVDEGWAVSAEGSEGEGGVVAVVGGWQREWEAGRGMKMEDGDAG